jgi:hypothetical protein
MRTWQKVRSDSTTQKALTGHPGSTTAVALTVVSAVLVHCFAGASLGCRSTASSASTETRSTHVDAARTDNAANESSRWAYSDGPADEPRSYGLRSSAPSSYRFLSHSEGGVLYGPWGARLKAAENEREVPFRWNFLPEPLLAASCSEHSRCVYLGVSRTVYTTEGPLGRLLRSSPVKSALRLEQAGANGVIVAV